MAVSEATQFAALEAATLLTSSGITSDMARLITVGQAMTTNIASAMVSERHGDPETAVLLVATTASMTESEVRSAQRAAGAMGAFFFLNDVEPEEQAAMIDGMDGIIADLQNIVAACEAWVAEVDDEHTARLDPARHAYTTTCDTHMQNPNEDAGTCCCCGCSEFDHIGAVIEDGA